MPKKDWPIWQYTQLCYVVLAGHERHFCYLSANDGQMIRFVVISLLLVGATAISGGFKVEENVPDQAGKLNLFGRDEMLRHLNEMYDYSMDNGQNLPAEEQPVGIYEEELRIPGKKVQANDSYLCTSFEQSAKSIGNSNSFHISNKKLFSWLRTSRFQPRCAPYHFICLR